MWDWTGNKGGYKKVVKKTPSAVPPAYPPRYSGYNNNSNNGYSQPNNGYQSPYPGYGVPDYSGNQWNDMENYQQAPMMPPQQMPPQQAYRNQAPQQMPPNNGGYHMPQTRQPMPPQSVQQQQQRLMSPPPQTYMQQHQPMMPQVMAPMNTTNEDLNTWEWEFENFNLPGMELQEVTMVVQSTAWKNDMRKAFKRARRDFLKFVGYHHQDECLEAGVDEEGLKLLKKGRAPENFNVHMKIPLDYLGTNDFSNLCLIKTHPFHIDLHKFLDLQITKQFNGAKPKRILLPVPVGKVYVPNNGTFSPGGKDKHDRSVYAGFLESTFEIIKMKSSMGRSADI
ncbi:MAG: hypothetical protein AB7U85_03040 [Alphaproteobacteria bacterium]